MNPPYSVPNIWATLINWYFDPTKSEWNAEFKNEEEKIKATEMIANLFKALREYADEREYDEIKGESNEQ